MNIAERKSQVRGCAVFVCLFISILMKMEELNVFRKQQYIKVSPNDKESLSCGGSALLADSHSQNLSVSNGWMTKERLPELCHILHYHRCDYGWVRRMITCVIGSFSPCILVPNILL